MTTSVQFHDDELERRMRQRINQNLRIAAGRYRNELRREISRPGRKGTRRAANRLIRAGRRPSNPSVSIRRGGTGRVLGFEVRSRPGEPPRKQTGRLRASISVETLPSLLRARVGTNLKYARFLEQGTRKMAARPYFAPVLDRMRDELAATIAEGVL